MIKVAINGFGRIGRPTFKRLIENKNIQVVAINDLADTKTLSHLLQYDSAYGKYSKKVDFTKKGIKVNGKEYLVLSEKDPSKLPWKKLGVDVVLECTGFFTKYEDAKLHLKAGAKKVIISAPSKSEEIKTFVIGGNEDKYSSEDIVSMASCTTNCLVPVLKILNDNLGIEKGAMTTIHSYTSSQKLVDSPHKDLRRARAAAINFMPTTTGAAIATIQVLPELKGKICGIAVRVPTISGSISDITVKVSKDTSVDEVNKIFEKAKSKILDVSDEELVSSDYIGNSHSAIIDKQFTLVEGKNLVKVLAWYDNEFGYSCRLAEFAEFIGKKI
ncbi:MAG: type I glyceraldehyde-3-phosphate dehydrogenase [Patescibacteria group bacterium]